MQIIFAFVFIGILSNTVVALHIKGEFNTNQFYKYLTRFGFKATDVHNVENTQGFIYGNVTFKNSNLSNQSLTLIILDKKNFNDFHKKQTILPRLYACQMMFNERLAVNLFNFDCNLNGTFDYTRRIPCPRNELCPDHHSSFTSIEKLPTPLDGSQFTIRLNHLNEAKFFYLSLVTCDLSRNQCKWANTFEHTNDIIEYSIYLTNGKKKFISRGSITMFFLYLMRVTSPYEDSFI